VQVLFYVVALAAGALNTVQSGQNVSLNKALGQPVLAATTVALANVAVYLAAAPFIGLGWPGAGKIAEVPWWAWFGGVLGALYVLATIFIADKVGAAAFTGLTVTAAVVTSIALDHWGLVGFAVHEAGLGRLAGGALMIGGLLLVCLT
jgi:bacterial/archaeal transporter family-2 protein